MQNKFIFDVFGKLVMLISKRVKLKIFNHIAVTQIIKLCHTVNLKYPFNKFKLPNKLS